MSGCALSGICPAFAGRAADAFEWSRLPALPDHEGFAGTFAGVSSGALLVAGGANFPGAKPWEGGKKRWYDAVFALSNESGQWKRAGRLPRPLGYGVALTVDEGMLCIGGSDVDRHHADVFLVRFTNGVVEIQPMPSLPMPLAQAAGALLGRTVLVAGGAVQPGEQAALSRVMALDLAQDKPAWRELEPLPGKPRILPVAAVADGRFYVVGGAALEPMDGKIARAWLRDGWSYRFGDGWKRIGDLPNPAVAAPSPAPVAGSKFFVLGGDDGSLAGFKPVAKHPGFTRKILAFDTASGQWSDAGEMPVSRVTVPAVRWHNRVVLPSGEARPGVRSPEVWSCLIRANQ